MKSWESTWCLSTCLTCMGSWVQFPSPEGIMSTHLYISPCREQKQGLWVKNHQGLQWFQDQIGWPGKYTDKPEKKNKQTGRSLADDITQWQSTRLQVQFLAPQYIKRKQTETRNHESDKCTVLDENATHWPVAPGLLNFLCRQSRTTCLGITLSSVGKQENAPQSCLQVNLIEALAQLRSLL